VGGGLIVGRGQSEGQQFLPILLVTQGAAWDIPGTRMEHWYLFWSLSVLGHQWPGASGYPEEPGWTLVGQRCSVQSG
jgi:hypothetical protein